MFGVKNTQQWCDCCAYNCVGSRASCVADGLCSSLCLQHPTCVSSTTAGVATTKTTTTTMIDDSTSSSNILSVPTTTKAITTTKLSETLTSVDNSLSTTSTAMMASTLTTQPSTTGPLVATVTVPVDPTSSAVLPAILGALGMLALVLGLCAVAFWCNARATKRRLEETEQRAAQLHDKPARLESSHSGQYQDIPLAPAGSVSPTAYSELDQIPGIDQYQSPRANTIYERRESSPSPSPRNATSDTYGDVFLSLRDSDRYVAVPVHDSPSSGQSSLCQFFF